MILIILKNYAVKNFKFSEEWVVILMFTIQPPIHPSMYGFRDPQLQRLKGWICGPSRASACPLGKHDKQINQIKNYLSFLISTLLQKIDKAGGDDREN